MTAALERGEWSAARPGRTLPPGKTRYPFYRKLGGPQGRSGRTENLVPTGIRSRTFQPVAQSLYRLSYPAHTTMKVKGGKCISIFIFKFVIRWRWEPCFKLQAFCPRGKGQQQPVGGWMDSSFSVNLLEKTLNVCLCWQTSRLSSP